MKIKEDVKLENIPPLLRITKENIEKVGKWVKKQERYMKDDECQRMLFEQYANSTFDEVYLKTVYLNFTHSTQMRGSECLKIAKTLAEKETDTDFIIENGDWKKLSKLIEKLQEKKSQEEKEKPQEDKSLKRIPYSFLTKYFSNSERILYEKDKKDSFPIFDNLVKDLITILRNNYYDFSSKKPSFGNYEEWYVQLNEIKDSVGQGVTFKEIDWYFWFLGRQISRVGSAVHKYLLTNKKPQNKSFYLRSFAKYQKKNTDALEEIKEIPLFDNKKFTYNSNFIESVLKFIEENEGKF